ncbi:hypothetical protein D3C85_1842410 [compost metagenome]
MTVGVSSGGLSRRVIRMMLPELLETTKYAEIMVISFARLVSPMALAVRRCGFSRKS